jgi:CRISPR/Cas system CSM-associated protein Csm2 small subunit
MENYKRKNGYNKGKGVYNKKKDGHDGYNEKRDQAIKKFNEENFSTDSLSHTSVDVIKEFMQYYVDDMTSSQLRNVYSVILDKNIGPPAKRVKIAYVAARNSKTGMLTLLNKLDKMLSEEVKYETIRNFAEACVAYHKYFESQKK